MGVLIFVGGFHDLYSKEALIPHYHGKFQWLDIHKKYLQLTDKAKYRDAEQLRYTNNFFESLSLLS